MRRLVYVESLEVNHYKLKINGYTDSAGDDSYNMQLSKQRAKRVSKHLMDRGIDEKSIEQSAYGKTSAAVATLDGAYQKRNRRVEIEIEGK